MRILGSPPLSGRVRTPPDLSAAHTPATPAGPPPGPGSPPLGPPPVSGRVRTLPDLSAAHTLATDAGPRQCRGSRPPGSDGRAAAPRRAHAGRPRRNAGAGRGRG